MVNGVLLLFFCVAAGDGGSWQLALAPALAFVSLLSPLGTVRGFQFCAFRVTWLNLCTAAWGEKRVRERDWDRESTRSILTVCEAKQLLLALLKAHQSILSLTSIPSYITNHLSLHFWTIHTQIIFCPPHTSFYPHSYPHSPVHTHSLISTVESVHMYYGAYWKGSQHFNQPNNFCTWCWIKSLIFWEGVSGSGNLYKHAHTQLAFSILLQRFMISVLNLLSSV